MKTLFILLAGGFLLAAPLRAADEKPAVQAAVEHYFSSWSARDMTAYENAFHPDAIIFFCGKDGRVDRSPVQPFVEGQKQAHAQSPVAMNEVPDSIEIATRGDYATAFTHWKLTIGEKIETGTDAFTLVKTKGGWKILSLVFGSD